MAKKNLSTVDVKFNNTIVAPKMLTSDWDEVYEHMEKIREIGRRAANRKKVYTHYMKVHLAEYVRDELIGKIYRLTCTGKEVYLGMVCKWTIEYEREVTCKRCLKRLGKNVTEVYD